VEHRKEFQSFLANSIGDYVRGVRHYEFPSSEYPSGPAQFRLCSKEIDRCEDSAGHHNYALFRVTHQMTFIEAL
jgi:hypothetical protein